MRLIYGLVLLLILLIVFIRSYKLHKDIFSPMCIFALLQAVRYVPGMLFYENHMNVALNSNNLFVTFAIELLVIGVTALGYYSKTKLDKRERESTYNFKLSAVATIAIIIGIIAQLYFLSRVGGISVILSNTKGNYGNGNSYISALTFLSVFGTCILISLKNKKYLPLIVLGLAGYLLPTLIQLRRSPILECFLFIVFTYHYCVKRIRIRSLFKIRTIAVIVLVIMFIVVVPTIRDSGSVSNVRGYIDSTTQTNVVDSFFKEMSYTARDTFIYEEFDSEHYYLGRTLINLATAPIPSAFYHNKPPVDDGLYLYNFIKGHYVVPPSNDIPLYNSYPFSTQGSLFANFGIIGVIIGCFLMGKIYRRAYNYLLNNKRDPYVCIFYFCTIYQLELSSLSVVQTFTPIVIVFVFNKFIAGRKVTIKDQKI